jgi:DNA-binding transcriptional MocR family regulator
VTSPAWPRHLRALTRALVLRRDAAVAALRQDWPAARLALVPDGGYHLWVELPPGVDDLAFTRAAAAVGVHVSAGRRWFPAEPTGSFVRLSYAGADEAALREGIRRLGRL